MAMAPVPVAGSPLSKVAAGRSSLIRTTASPDGWSKPTSVATWREPPGSMTVTDFAPESASHVVTMKPPASATRPVVTVVPDDRSMIITTVDGRTADIMASEAITTGPPPGSVVGAAVRVTGLVGAPGSSCSAVPVVTMTTPATTNARTMQAVPPTIQGPDRDRVEGL